MAAMATHIIDGAEISDEELALARRYPMVVTWSPEYGVYVASFPGLPGIRAYGKSVAEAAQQGAEVIVAYVTGHLDAGLPLPEPVALEQFA